MPAVAMSSVVVVSTARAQRMQRRTWTEALGGQAESMAKLVDEVAEAESESEDTDEDEEDAELLAAGMMRERRGREAWLANSGIWTIL